MADNPNGNPTFKAVKSPGKLNTSFWETKAFNDGNGGDAAKKSTKKKKKKSKMASMWEQRAAEEAEKQKVEKTIIPRKKSIEADAQSSANTDIQSQETAGSNSDKSDKSENVDVHVHSASTNAGDVNGAVDTPPKTTKRGGSSKVAALAGKLNINPMGLKGGLPPSLRKKKEEQKNETDLSEQEFLRPVIPPLTRRKSTKKNIIAVSKEQINEELRTCLQENFVFDDRMVVSGNLLCCYLKDIASIDLSMIGDEAWNEELLKDAVKEVFSEKAMAAYGYSLKTI